MDLIKWLAINYNLPTEPSRLRVSTWRKLKKLGAVNIQQSMWVLPENDDNRLALENLSHEIEANSGEVLLMQSVFLYEKHQEKVVSSFNNIRDEEYKELIGECEKYLKEIEKEISIEKFTFAELEEEEEELNKLLSWYAKIEARDIFYSSQRDNAKAKLTLAKEYFENYNDMVYKHNN